MLSRFLFWIFLPIQPQWIVVSGKKGKIIIFVKINTPITAPSVEKRSNISYSSERLEPLVKIKTNDFASVWIFLK